MYKGTGEIETCKTTYSTQIKPLRSWPLPLLVSGLTAQLFHLKCNAEDTELRTGLRPQTHRPHTKLYSKPFSEVRYISEYPINTQCFKQTACGEVRCRETGWRYDRAEGWIVNLIRCFPCAHKRSHACSKEVGDVLKVKSWKRIP